MQGLAEAKLALAVEEQAAVPAHVQALAEQARVERVRAEVRCDLMP